MLEQFCLKAFARGFLVGKFRSGASEAFCMEFRDWDLRPGGLGSEGRETAGPNPNDSPCTRQVDPWGDWRAAPAANDSPYPRQLDPRTARARSQKQTTAPIYTSQVELLLKGGHPNQSSSKRCSWTPMFSDCKPPQKGNSQARVSFFLVSDKHAWRGMVFSPDLSIPISCCHASLSYMGCVSRTV